MKYWKSFYFSSSLLCRFVHIFNCRLWCFHAPALTQHRKMYVRRVRLNMQQNACIGLPGRSSLRYSITNPEDNIMLSTKWCFRLLLMFVLFYFRNFEMILPNNFCLLLHKIYAQSLRKWHIKARHSAFRQ